LTAPNKILTTLFLSSTASCTR